jgi:hypothetical protein
LSSATFTDSSEQLWYCMIFVVSTFSSMLWMVYAKNICNYIVFVVYFALQNRHHLPLFCTLMYLPNKTWSGSFLNNIHDSLLLISCLVL